MIARIFLKKLTFLLVVFISCQKDENYKPEDVFINDEESDDVIDDSQDIPQKDADYYEDDETTDFVSQDDEVFPENKPPVVKFAKLRVGEVDYDLKEQMCVKGGMKILLTVEDDKQVKQLDIYMNNSQVGVDPVSWTL